MSRRLTRTNLLLALAAVGAATLLGAQGCDSASAGAVPFEAVGLRSGEEPICRNEPVVIRFNRSLAESAPALDTVSLTDDRGRPVPFAMEPCGRFLSIRPTQDAGWPTTSSLTVRLVWPPITSSIKSASGEKLGGTFEHAVRVTARHRPGEGALTVVSSLAKDLQPGGRPGESPSQERKLVFNAAVDPKTLSEGLVIMSLATGAEVSRDAYRVRISENDGRVVYISHLIFKPDADPGVHVFNGGGRYQVVVTPALATYDGRRPLRRQPVVHYNTPKKPFGFIHVDFDEESDYHPSSYRFFVPGSPLKPNQKSRAAFTVPQNLSSVQTSSTVLFGVRPGTVFIRIPADYLPEKGRQEAYIESIRFVVSGDTDTSAQVLDFEATLGYLMVGQDGKLGQIMADNEELLVRPPRAQPYDSRELRRRRLAGPGGVEVDILEIPLSPPTIGPGLPEQQARTPFFYDGSGRDLLLMLRSGGLSSPRGQLAIHVEVFDPRNAEQNNLVIAFDGQARGISSRILPRMGIFTYRYVPVLTRWYQIPEFPHPEFSRTRNLDFQGRGWEAQDFVIEYQGARVLPDGELGTNSPWMQQPPRGPWNAVRFRITPKPQSRTLGEEEIEIDSFTLHFTWGKEN